MQLPESLGGGGCIPTHRLLKPEVWFFPLLEGCPLNAPPPNELPCLGGQGSIVEPPDFLPFATAWGLGHCPSEPVGV